MKKIFIIVIALMSSIIAFAQNSGLGFNYQAVVRDINGILLANSNETLRISLFPGQQASTPTWVETHAVHTDLSGSFGITVGTGVRQSNSTVNNFSDINFSSAYYWMKIEILEGSTYREVSYSQLPSSPYSEVAYNAASLPFPPGMIMAFAGPASNIPAGWLLCDGAEVSRTTYSNLYNAIGVSWGTGNNSTTFNLPDLRGMFLRGVAGADTVGDPDANSRVSRYDNGGNTGNNVGSYQGDAIRNITGSVHNNIQGHREWGGQSEGALEWMEDKSNASWEDSTHGYSGISFDASRVVPVGSDNRPKNVYVTYIIKY